MTGSVKTPAWSTALVLNKGIFIAIQRLDVVKIITGLLTMCG